jgi:uracil-DNA glycosylase
MTLSSPTFKIALIGEAYGEVELAAKKPFLGPAGQELNRQLADAGISREECYITNVFNLRPDRNKVESLCGPAKDPGVLKGSKPIAKGLYLRSEYARELTRLYDELASVRPNIAVLLGNTAAWALLGTGAISKIRGTCSYSTVLSTLKVLPTYHPSNIFHQYENRHVAVLDLMKARRESEFPELRRPLREVWTDPDLDDMEIFYDRFLSSARRIAMDVETAIGQVTCISFAPTIDRVIVVPFLDHRFPGAHYWRTKEDEVRAWEWVRKVCQLPAEKVGQNILYDVQYLWQAHGIPIRNVAHDTMLLHHSMHPESPKSLGFLGSIYTNEIAWKPMRPRGKHQEKREDEE